MSADEHPALRPHAQTRMRHGKPYTVQVRHPAWYREVYDLWRLGLNDGEISRSLGRTVCAIYTARAQGLKLPANAYPGQRGGVGEDDEHDE